MGRKRKMLLDTVLHTHIVTYICFYLFSFCVTLLFIYMVVIHIYNQKRLCKHVCLPFEQTVASDLRSACQLRG